ncbi:MAG: hypothetical protein ACLGIG_06035 [Actinomycetes bacterium]
MLGRRALAGVVGAVLVLTACSGGADGDGQGSTASTPTSGSAQDDDTEPTDGDQSTDLPADIDCSDIDDDAVTAALGGAAEGKAQLDPGDPYPAGFGAGAGATAQAEECLYAGPGGTQAALSVREATPGLFEGLRSSGVPGCEQGAGAFGPDSFTLTCPQATPRVVHRVLFPSSIFTCLVAAPDASTAAGRSEAFCAAAAEQLAG